MIFLPKPVVALAEPTKGFAGRGGNGWPGKATVLAKRPYLYVVSTMPAVWSRRLLDIWPLVYTLDALQSSKSKWPSFGPGACLN